MNSITSKVSYLNGLIDGLELDLDSKEGKVLKEIVYILGDMAEEIEQMKDSQEDMQEYIDALDEDLNLIEDEIYDEEDEDYDMDDIEDFIELECDNCGETVYIDTDILNEKDKVVCPNCHKDIPIEFQCDCNCDECED